jgi:hypothetical protein
MMIKPMFVLFNKRAERAEVKLPDRDFLKKMETGRPLNLDAVGVDHAKSKPFVDLASDSSHMSSVADFFISKNRENSDRGTGVNPFAYQASASPSSGIRLTKSNSATAPQGYTSKVSI